ncbi:MAG: flagellar hook-length control protein FliK [Lachnospiraceae bacterium]|nr:flagellar hook-length control protein FliK [Lachnospiraceae bacterium]
MRLTDLFRTDTQISDAGRIQQPTPARTVQMNQQIRALAPGQTLQGEVVARNGGEVQIKVADDFVLNAKMDQNMNIEVGKNMTFEVKNNGSTLTLSPLFTNTATDANIMKALDMAALPVNETTVNMTGQMMSAGLSIDRGSLQQMFREVNLFPQAQSADLVDLHKLAMPINESNVNQMISYRNLTHQLISGMTNIMDELPNVFSELLTSGNTDEAVALYQALTQLTDMAVESGENTQSLGEAPQEAGALENAEGAIEGASEAEIEGTNKTPIEGINETEIKGINETEIKGTIKVVIGEAAEGLVAGTGTEQALTTGNAATHIDSAAAKVIIDESALADSEKVNGTANEPLKTQPVLQEGALAVNLEAEPESPVEPEQVSMQQITESEADGALSLQQTEEALTRELAQNPEAVFARLAKEGVDAKSLQNLLKPLTGQMMEKWTISPEDVEDSKKIEDLYRRLDSQLKGVAKALESAGQTDSASYKAVTNMSQNLDFMQQINQMYAYVQLPLRLQQGNAHGDLYVYTNKKNLAMKDGNISALLHLDMEHLGPVDVYVAMQAGEKVNTRFYVQDDEMLDFLEAHMELLTQRLQKRGYDCSFDMQVRTGAQTQKSGIEQMLAQDNHMPLAEYAFDVRT